MAEELANAISEAARVMKNADFLLLASGAGLSADSGLATFATLTAKMGAQLGEGVTYDHAAGSDTMARDPQLFYAFWLSSLQNYCKTEPHAGYNVLREWRLMLEGRAASRRAEDNVLSEPEHPAFVLTSNVDGWSSFCDVAAPGALAQIHGCIHQWQCGGAPSGKRFPTFTKDRCCDDLFEPPSAEGLNFDAVPLRYEQPPPRCPKCKDGWLRPHIYLFGDGSRFINKEDVTGEQRFRRWQEETLAALRAKSNLKLVIVEIGCGLRVPNIRKRCETLFAGSPQGQCEFVRINPEATDQKFEAKPTVFVQSTALAALENIQSQVLELASSQ
mmetsp:Transcript_77832/g.150356  ORF Transcript_77832/g.150356 Transcript_77832/m.150356 type:complete len:330 (-) Transcript_77832:235-1224(-)|eukprot:CAMPEP_0172665620 /NCGR_PEP_ID=MMETSP1074-20121228/7363_1 /TAXON_ID=2916 /ORGANISM="Ceratium fusus, Strain PA161109" /LENGTH=329 /DNA_ID=CAMNT_0013481961 /DNA_START=61 /DNA_END=1050 /DNA_ORIENTATION=+